MTTSATRRYSSCRLISTVSPHRRPYRRTKPWPKRPSMYEPFEARIKEWLKQDPALSAFGSDFRNLYTAGKQQELQEFSLRVTDVEYDAYIRIV
ncbi:hypothetical protein [Mesorhizobium sp.]|uniref:hypothetical protein n=2 Tax=Mesorhizobium TaxID=68287 RepID=UPI000FE32C36|nr:hypothetical protein [Mesorhizobium sp.]RWG87134.1 MAG: hypothetical protein EOQ70_14010 [Mesorhizobium sp.]RWK18228.1 MAG: hypothetical protein EOR41_13725 [Mesorhizobium sp.]